MSSQPLPWALILAGGDGTRLLPLTTRIAGDARPKQFCAILDGDTLLDHTRRRAELLARPDQQVIVVTRAHAPYFRSLRGELAPGCLVVQPANRGTGPGIVAGLLRIHQLAGDVPVVVLPSDHWVGDDLAFGAYVRDAVAALASRPDLVVLLGIEARDPETEYGWIEPAAAPLPLEGTPLFPIRRFHEKPALAAAEALFRAGALWNTLVMAGHVTTFLDLVRDAAPAHAAALAPVCRARREASALETVYARLPAWSFSQDVLAARPRRLAVVRVKGVEWSDLGHPDRVLAMVRRAGRRPPWLAAGARVPA
jgi:mannose-1-phosphate guanylyltransferase